MGQYAGRGVHGQTVETIAGRILSGQLPEGATLDLGALQHEFDVSLTVMREALRVLAAKGMIDARPKRGTFARGPTGACWTRTYCAGSSVSGPSPASSRTCMTCAPSWNPARPG
ncbi:FadR/GntR family transcriptional regulator [Fodinicola feengrottensis]|uniref:FadR/GntR family transcriptional regulator n=1 Tax=Fodinicola feengrottensis TaxID=435914 RepID=UPI0024416626|nr:GntR family transcriptional regulator [Fodinicola feengrottensis]